MKSMLRNLFRYLTYQTFAPGTLLRETYEAFKAVLMHNRAGMELMTEIETIYHEQRKVDLSQVQALCERLSAEVSAIVEQLNLMSPIAYAELPAYCKKITFYITLALETMHYDFRPPYVIALRDIPRNGEAVAGGKSWRLSSIKRELGLPVPDGFAVTASAFRYLIESNNLKHEIDAELSQLDVYNAAQLEAVATRLSGLLMEADVPDDIAHEILAASDLITSGDATVRFAVRSSAVGEDGPFSFAGQHRSVLNASADGLLFAYKQVIASKYSPQALHYRIGNGLIDVDMPMAVLFLPMLHAESAGVIYTADPNDASVKTVAIHAVRGLGEALVSGMVSAERYEVTRDIPPKCIRHTKGKQADKTIIGDSQSLVVVPVAESGQTSPLLSDDDCRVLGDWALQMENYFAGPMDIEWCRDNDKGLMILQARPLHITHEAGPYPRFQLPADVKTLMRHGVRAVGGCASGPVFVLAPDRSIDEIPQGSVLVAVAASPELSVVTHRLVAAVFEVGSPAGHFASIARECGLPMMVQARGAMDLLSDGLVVTVDADHARICEGELSELCRTDKQRKDEFLESPFRKKVRMALDLISPLTLTDTLSSNFTPAGCRTLHDIIRFCHERAMHEMFSLGRHGKAMSGSARRILTRLPIVLYLHDISGETLRGRSSESSIAAEEIDHRLFQAFLSGLNHPDIYWPPQLLHIDWKQLEQAESGGIVGLDSPLLASFAILSNDYLNLNMRFGYHFAVIDSLCSGRDEESYVMFSFKGGGSEQAGIMLRVLFLITVLKHHGFQVTTKGDFVEAELTHCNAEKVLNMLNMIGALLGCTRLLDYVLQDEASVSLLAERFLAGDYNFAHLHKLHAEDGGPNRGRI